MKAGMRLGVATVVVATLALTGCSAAMTTSSNLSTAADNFEINRRIVFFNGITDTYLMTIEGLCSIEPDTVQGQLEVTCKVGDDEYKKHFLGLSDNVSYFVEQIDAVAADPFRYRVIFRPETIVPDIDIETSG
jgi:hypothetical protein